MAIPITLSESIFPAAGFNPGSGLLAVCVKDEYDFNSTEFEEAVLHAIPVLRHYGRPSPYLSGKGRNLVYAAVAAEVRDLYNAWNLRKKPRRLPVFNRQWLDAWLERMHLEKDDTINRLGVASPLDTVSLGVTSRGGKKLVINTFEEYFGEVFASRYKEAYTKIEDEDTLLDALTDVSVLTALSKLGRMVMYYAIADAAGWRRIQSLDYLRTTLTAGINTELWEVFNGEVRVSDGEVFLLPAETDSWMACVAPKGKDNRAFPWRVIHLSQGEPSVSRQYIQTRVSLTCLPPEKAWKAERDECRAYKIL